MPVEILWMDVRSTDDTALYVLMTTAGWCAGDGGLMMPSCQTTPVRDS